MVVLGDYIFWSYIHPLDDPDHHASIMRWDQKSEPELFMVSQYSASDFMLSVSGELLHIIERRYVASSDAFEIRILRSNGEENLQMIQDWVVDTLRMGEGGFHVAKSGDIIFAKYPEIWMRKPDGKVVNHFHFKDPVKMIRYISENRFLLLGDTYCSLVDSKGIEIERWENLPDINVDNPPLGRNIIFDVDYQNGQLLVANWGARTFMLIENDHKIIISEKQIPYAPHWVAFLGKRCLLFSSSLTFDGDTPKPSLELYSGILDTVWEK